MDSSPANSTLHTFVSQTPTLHAVPILFLLALHALLTFSRHALRAPQMIAEGWECGRFTRRTPHRCAVAPMASSRVRRLPIGSTRR